MLLPVCVESEQYPLIRASLDGLRDCGELGRVEMLERDSSGKEVCLEKANSNAYRLYYLRKCNISSWQREQSKAG